MKKAKVFFKEEMAGILIENEEGYTFQYEAEFLKSENAEALSLTMPLTERPYKNKVLFPSHDFVVYFSF